LLLATAADGSWLREGFLSGADSSRRAIDPGLKGRLFGVSVIKVLGYRTLAASYCSSAIATMGQGPHHVGPSRAPAGVKPLMAGAFRAPSLPARAG